jgi:DNA/RNA endonuclease YhcR with UshA esterase domain
MLVKRGLVGLGVATAALVMLAQTGLVRAAGSRPVIPVEAVTTEYAGKIVSVEARVVSTRPFKAGVRYRIEQDDAGMTLVLFDRVLKQKELPVFGPGARIRATGRVEFYRNDAQLVVARAADISVLEAAAPETVLPLKALGSEKTGARVTVTGQVFEASAFKAGFKLGLDDGTGRTRLTLFEKTFARLPDVELLSVGVQVTVTGALSEYEGEREVIVETLRVGAPGAVAQTVRDYALGKLSGNDHNAMVRVRGEIVEVKPFEFGLDVLIKDESGVGRVRIGVVLVEYVKKKTPLEPGRRIEVTGRVRAARATGVRVEPALPGDVRVDSDSR